MYFVFSYAIHNYRVKLAWDDREEEFKDLETEMEKLKTQLSDGEWLASTEKKIKSSKQASNGDALRQEIEQILNPEILSLSETVLKRQKKAKKEGKHEDDNAFSSLVGALVPSSTAVEGERDQNNSSNNRKRIL